MRSTFLVVDDSPGIVSSISRILRNFGDVRGASNVAGAIETMRDGVCPTGSVLDVVLPDGLGFVVLDEIRRRSPHASILVLTGNNKDEYANRAADDDAVYVTKPIHPHFLKHWANKAIARERVPNERVADLVAEAAKRHHLSPREVETLSRFVAGKTRVEIATGMEIEERTLQAHVSSIVQKTGTLRIEGFVSDILRLALESK